MQQFCNHSRAHAHTFFHSTAEQIENIQKVIINIPPLIRYVQILSTFRFASAFLLIFSHFAPY